jgi:predicted nuclease of restriction endonuclease-like RecB superfamily
MLTGDLLRADVGRSRVRPRFVDPRDQGLLALAGELVQEFVAHVGKTRGELQAALEGRARAGDRVRLERGLSKLLADRSEFERQSELEPEVVRALVFARAAEARRAGTFSRESVLAEAAAALGVAEPRTVEVALDADRRSRERLLAFESIEPRALLERYDVALAQAVLLRAVRVKVALEGRPRRLRDILRAIKFRQLLFKAEKTKPGGIGGAGSPRGSGGVTLELDGPLSLFESSTKYGLNLAEVLPAILLCERFSLEAELAWGKKRSTKQFILTSEDGLASTRADPGAAPPPELEAFAKRFEELAPGWKVGFDARIHFVGGEAIVPDLGFTHEATGRKGALELIANARRGSLPSRLALLHANAPSGLVVAVARNLLEDGAVLPPGVVVYRSMPAADEVKAQLERAFTAARR